MSRKKTVAARVNHPHASTPRRSPEQDAFVDYFLSTVCDPSRRSILELLAEPSVQDPSVLYERRSGEIAHRACFYRLLPLLHYTNLIYFGNERNTLDSI